MRFVVIPHPVGLRSLALSFPRTIRTNDYYRQNYPELVAQSEQKSLATLFSLPEFGPSNEFDLEMQPYLSDPFRGTVERRVLGLGETSLTLEHSAAKDALDAAELSPEDIDLMLVASMLPEQIGIGNATFLASQLGLSGAAWNLESTGSSAIVALQSAKALIQTGEYRNVLVVISTTYSRFTDENDTLSFLSGDGAGAFVVSALEANQGLLGTKIVNTPETCGAFFWELDKDVQGNLRMFIRIGKNANKVLSSTSVRLVRTCCEGAAAAAGVTLDQIDFFAFSTPTAWYTHVYTRVLGIKPERTINIHPWYANIGAVFPVANLYHGVQSGRIHKNDLVLVYTFGVSATAAATVMRWSDVALGPAPPSINIDWQRSQYSNSGIPTLC